MVFLQPVEHTAWDAYFLAQLAYYRRHGGPPESLAVCYQALSSHYVYLGDYSQAVSYCLQAAELYYPFSPNAYRAALAAAGSTYAEWGNTAKGLHYLRQATRGPGSQGSRYYAFLRIAQINLRRQHYAETLHAIDQFLGAKNPNNVAPKTLEAYALLIKGMVVLAQGHAAEAGPLLQATQHLADSLSMKLEDAAGFFELDATWARYYAARHEPTRAEAYWLSAYRKAQLAQATPLRLGYLCELSRFYQQQHQPAAAARYALAALGLTDTRRAAEGALHVARYEIERTDRVQTLRIARLRQAQILDAAHARRQRLLLGAALGVLALIGGLVFVLWRSNRRQQRANALLATQKAQIEEQAARLGELDEAKNQFFANASHELRTPLTLVLGPLATLLTDPAQVLPAAVRAPVALAHRQAQRLQQLVNRILDLTKLQAGRLVLHPGPTPLASLLRRVLAQFESLAAQRGIALHGPAALPEGLRLLLDADKVEEILTNLLINALNHTPAGGAVRMTVALPDADGLYSVTVRDTGPGIAQAEQARVFERFYQSPQGQAQGGTGLGLALSRELAQLLGGSLTLVSEAGQGAAFTLRFPGPELPAASAPAPESAPAEEPAALPEPLLPAAADAARRPRILVVEDQPDLREYLRGLLAPAYEVLLAADGQAALELLAREAPVDLIITDAMMPRLSGTELLARLRADPAQHTVPVLMLTARADEAHRLAALTVGVDDYLTKLFATAELLARVRALLARHQVRRHFAALPPEEEEPAAGPGTLAAPPLTGPVASVAPPTRRRRAEPATAAAQLAHWQARVAGQLANEQFGPAELAELLCLNERTLYRRLGEPPAAWLRELRLAQARRLLEAGSFGSVAEVADAVGFASPKYFATLYAERFGRRPADYRA